MEIAEQSRQMVVCHQSTTSMRVKGIVFFGLGTGGMVAITRSLRPGVFVGGPIMWYILSALFIVAGFMLFLKAEDTRIVLDAAAQVARIIRRGLNGQSTTIEIPFASIADVALEMKVIDSGRWRTQAWRVVFVTRDNRRVPWTRVSNNDRASQARAVAAARAIGGWNAAALTEGEVPVVSSK